MTQENDINTRAKAVCEQHYGESGVEISALPGDVDCNLMVKRKGVAHGVLKVMRPDADPAHVALQCRLLAHVAHTAPDLPLPAVVPRSDGALWGEVDWQDGTRLAWLIGFCAGRVQASLPPLSVDSLRDLGAAIGKLHTAMADFEDPLLDRPLKWNLTEAARQATQCHHIKAPLDRVAARVLARFSREASPALAAMPAQAIHNDLNDHNILFLTTDMTPRLAALIDVGDAARQPPVCDLAIACAYSAMRQPDPIGACVALAAGYASTRPLSADESDLLPLLVKTRLAVSLAVSSRREHDGDTDPYNTVSQQDAGALLTALEAVPEGVFRLHLRRALDLAGLPHAARVGAFLASAEPAPVMDASAGVVLDLGVGSQMLGADPANGALQPLTRLIDEHLIAQKTDVGLGRYLEPRLLYGADGFGADGHATSDRRTVHLGVDVFAPAGSPVRAPLAGRIHDIDCLDLPLDYGPVVMLRHDLPDGESFFTLYGHLDRDSVAQLSVGDLIGPGDVLARIGAPPGNGGWPPHLHLQLILDDLGLGVRFPGVCDPRDVPAYAELCPNPALLVNRSDADALDARTESSDLAQRRQRVLGSSLSLSYRTPLHIVRGFGSLLYDEQARAYLDFYNNVAHVGHGHPHVVDAVSRQMALLNTNTRYLHETILSYAERLTARLPEPLSVCFFVNSASEANELALRMAREATGRNDIVVAAGAYHGHTSALIDMSPYKYAGPGGRGRASWVHEVPVADDYRGVYKRAQSDAGPRYGADVAACLDALPGDHACAAFIAETMPSVGGQIIPPAGYLATTYDAVRRHGGLCIADEVQTGFGRLGDAFWGFETQDVVPDIVVLGKPIANGFPMGALVTTPDIAAAFDTGMEFFATFGGNPVACAAASAMLDVLDTEALPARAARLGAQLIDALRDMATRTPLIGDVRGMGFFLGVELVRDRSTLEPAAREAAEVVERLRHYRILAGVDGPLHNVIKLRPTLATTDADMTFAIAIIEQVFCEVSALV